MSLESYKCVGVGGGGPECVWSKKDQFGGSGWVGEGGYGEGGSDIGW